MNTSAFEIPDLTLEDLYKVPNDRPVVLLLRHAEREALPPGDIGYDVPITQSGSASSYQLGTNLTGRLKTLRTSPVPRCIQTAECIRQGANEKIEIYSDSALGNPGVFVENPELAWKNWQTMGNEGVMHHLATSEHVLPGMVHPKKAAQRLVLHMLQVAGKEPGVHVFVTHDVFLSATTARILGLDVLRPWPRFLEGGFFWREEPVLVATYRSVNVRLVDGE